MTPEDARAVIRALPEIEEGFNMNSPFFKVNGKVLTRILGEADIQLGNISALERETLIEADPAVFHSTSHFNDARMMLARIEPLTPEVLRGFMVRRWRELVPKAWLKRPDAPS